MNSRPRASGIRADKYPARVSPFTPRSLTPLTPVPAWLQPLLSSSSPAVATRSVNSEQRCACSGNCRTRHLKGACAREVVKNGKFCRLCECVVAGCACPQLRSDFFLQPSQTRGRRCSVQREACRGCSSGRGIYDAMRRGRFPLQERHRPKRPRHAHLLDGRHPGALSCGSVGGGVANAAPAIQGFRVARCDLEGRHGGVRGSIAKESVGFSASSRLPRT